MLERQDLEDALVREIFTEKQRRCVVGVNDPPRAIEQEQRVVGRFKDHLRGVLGLVDVGFVLFLRLL